MIFRRFIFISRIVFIFFVCLFKKEENNIDFLRFGKDHKASTMGFWYIFKSMGSFIINKRFFKVYDLLEDNFSKTLLIKLLLFRILSSGHVKLPLNNDDFWSKYNTIDEKYLSSKGEVKVGRFSLNNYEIENNDENIKLLAHPLSILNTFLLKQYCYSRDGATVCVKKDDVVIDAGACWGDTAVYFAQKAGDKGAVYSFEFENKNLEIFRRNISLNQTLSKVISIKEFAVWDISGDELSFEEGGPGTSLLDQKIVKSNKVKTLSIDDMVRNENLRSVDFIKMDIEGAEGRALKGAIETIKQYKPKLAISIYHSLKDFTNLPIFLSDLNLKYDLGYKFYLDHFTIYSEETVLFAISDKRE